jgi:hypothetical protein
MNGDEAQDVLVAREAGEPQGQSIVPEPSDEFVLTYRAVHNVTGGKAVETFRM